MVVDCEVYHWTPRGMVRGYTVCDAYLPVRVVEQLLEEAHARGLRAGREKRDTERQP